MTGIEMISAERSEHESKHGRTIQQDAKFNNKGQLSVAAGILSQAFIPAELELIPIGWDEALWNKMLDKPYKDRLVIAGSLIAAELDRVQYEETIKAMAGEELKYGNRAFE